MKRILLFALLTVTVLMANAQDKWYQYGVKIGTSFPTVREYSVNGDFLSGSGNADFGVFFRAGRYVFGEVGFGYTFLKGVYDYYTALAIPYICQVFQLRCFQLALSVPVTNL